MTVVRGTKNSMVYLITSLLLASFLLVHIHCCYSTTNAVSKA